MNERRLVAPVTFSVLLVFNGCFSWFKYLLRRGINKVVAPFQEYAYFVDISIKRESIYDRFTSRIQRADISAPFFAGTLGRVECRLRGAPAYLRASAGS